MVINVLNNGNQFYFTPGSIKDISSITSIRFHITSLRTSNVKALTQQRRLIGVDPLPRFISPHNNCPDFNIKDGNTIISPCSLLVKVRSTNFLFKAQAFNVRTNV